VTTKTETDWTIRHSGDSWVVFKDGRPDDGRDAPASLLGIFTSLRSMPGPAPDLPDVGVASTVKAPRGEFCPLSGKRIRATGFSHIEARAKRGEWEAAIFVYGRRQFLHPDGCELVAPHLDAALRSFYSEPPPAPSTEPEPARRRNLAAGLLVRAFEKMPESSSARSAWFVENAVRLLTAE
jgi:hypothetical protein